MKRYHSLLIACLVLCVNFAFAQVNVSTTIQNATCPNNGSITLNATGGAGSPTSYEFSITSGPSGPNYPLTTVSESSVTFNSLSPGNYAYTVTDLNDGNASEVSGTAQVGGNYTNMDVSVASNRPSCPESSTATLSVTVHSGGYGSKEYEIISGPETRGRQTSSVFNNLEAGTYTVRVYDQCDNFQTREHTISPSLYQPVELGPAGVDHGVPTDCDNADYKVAATHGLAPFTYTLLNPPSGYTGPTSQSSGEFNLPQSESDYNFQVTDACGRMDTYSLGLNEPYIGKSYSNEGCNSFDIQLIPQNFVPGYTYEITQAPASYTGSTSNTTGSFTNLPNGNYVFRVTDACSTSRIVAEYRDVVYEPELRSTPVASGVSNCTENLGNYTFGLVDGATRNYAVPMTFKILNPPSGYTQHTKTTATGTTMAFNDLPDGSYEVEVTDACGNTDTYTYAVDRGLETNLTYQVIPGCPGSNRVNATFLSNYPYGLNMGSSMPGRYRLYQGNTQVANNTTGQFMNLNAGNYTLYYTFYSTSISQNCYRSVAVTIPPYAQPYINSPIGYRCSDNTIDIFANSYGGGVPDYTFDLINASNGSELQSGSSVPEFKNLSATGSYRIRIVDVCGNSSVSDNAAITYNLNQQMNGDECADEGEAFPWYYTNNNSLTYHWTFPNSTTYTGPDPRSAIGSLDQNDFGDYTVQIFFRSDCVAQTTTRTLYTCEYLLPIQWHSIEAKPTAKGNLITWEVGQDKTSKQYIVERSLDQLHWVEIGQIRSQIESEQQTVYQFLDNNSLSANTYYRVKSMEETGHTDLSAVVAVKRMISDQFKVFPNPSHGNSQLYIPKIQGNQVLNIQMMDGLGHLIRQDKITADPTAGTLIDLNQYSLPTGLIFIIVSTDNQWLYKEKLFIY